LLALAGAVVLAQGQALAAPDDLDREKAQLRKENADLRELLRMRDENAALRQRLGQKGIEAPAPLPVAQSPRRAAAAPSGQASRAESAARSVTPSVFESYAADMPVKASPPVRAAIYDWTGFYVGANIGYGIGHDRARQVLDLGGGIVSTTFVDPAVAPRGAVGGLQIGYNWQGGRNWLVGFEADLQGTNQSGTSCAPVVCLSQIVGGVSSTRALTATQQLDWFGTLRGRVGAVNNNILFYATGGAAFGRVKETMAENLTGNGPANFTTNITTFNQTGWVAGGGIEAAFAGNWTAKAEYLYLDLGTIQSSFNDGTPSTINNTSTVRDHIFRAGVNYRFAGEPARWWQ
jgi:outer membrane immunogenic protein